ncbi:MAG: thiamine pyrophosphate-dependent enzyme [Candidatus Nealsonbacteria bacterium]|nr:thiamine pyrophosphate-dependent enzyme [Candidatus Nealsonbacteria bacterium]
MIKKILLGDEAIIHGALESGVSFVSGYPGCPSAEIGDEFLKIAKDMGVYAEWSTNEKVALEAAIGASFSGLKSLVNMKSFGINVCSDSLLPLAYTGTKAGMVIIVADDPSGWSSAQSEQDSRGYAYLSHIPMLEPADPQEAKDFTKLGYEISEKFNIPVILRITTRVAHQRAPVNIEDKKPSIKQIGEFISDSHQFVTMPPRVLEMKKELLEKIKKVREFADKSEANKISKGKDMKELGIIVSGVSYFHFLEAQKELGLDLSALKLGFFYPLPEDKIKSFIKPLKKVLIIEELNGYIEKDVKVIAKDVNPNLEVFGKNTLSEIGEFNVEKILSALSKITGKKTEIEKSKQLDLPRRTARLCEGCPYWHVFPTLKRIAPKGTVFGGDIGCYMIAGLPPHNMQDYLFSMGAGTGISHGVKKSTKQKVISLIGDATFFHAGIPAIINTVYNKSNPLIIVLDNRITAMTGHQVNPGMGKNLMGEDSEMLEIEDIVKACGVKNVKVIDQGNPGELEKAVKEFLEKDEVSVIVCRRICALLAKRQSVDQHE